MEKPKLGTMVLAALAKKGKAKMAPEEDKSEVSEDEDMHLQEIADDLVGALHDKDSTAVKELLLEFFHCVDALPHEESEHEDY